MIPSGFDKSGFESGLDGGFALDVQGVQRLRHDAARDPEGNLRAAANQFEALMLQMMLKSMREAAPRSGLFDSSQSRFHESLMDQQWAQHLSGKGFGLADQLVAQLNGQLAGRGGPTGSGQAARDDLLAGIPRGAPTDLRGREMAVADVPDQGRSAPVAAEPGTVIDDLLIAAEPRREAFPEQALPHRALPDKALSQGAPPSTASPPAGPDEFVERLRQPALAAAAETGIPAELMLAQAALETGWGRYRIPTADGGDSHNLFGIKAGGGWQGPVATITTHEYIDGRRVPVSAEFRVYDSYQAAFADYGRLVGDNPRYAAVASAASAEQAARALQAAGYATDPAYADKLIALIERSRQLVESG